VRLPRPRLFREGEGGCHRQAKHILIESPRFLGIAAAEGRMVDAFQPTSGRIVRHPCLPGICVVRDEE
jgi:hypothetical protein